MFGFKMSDITDDEDEDDTEEEAPKKKTKSVEKADEE